MLRINFKHIQEEIDKRKNSEEIISTINELKLNKNLYDCDVKSIGDIINNNKKDVGEILALEYYIHKFKDHIDDITSLALFSKTLSRYSYPLYRYCDNIKSYFLENTIDRIVETYSNKLIKTEILDTLIGELLDNNFKLNIMFRFGDQNYDLLFNEYTNDKLEIMKALENTNSEYLAVEGDENDDRFTFSLAHGGGGGGRTVIWLAPESYNLPNTSCLINYFRRHKNDFIVEKEKPSKPHIFDEIFQFILNKNFIFNKDNIGLEPDDKNKEFQNREEIVKYITNCLEKINIPNETTKNNIIKYIDTSIDEALKHITINSMVDDLLENGCSVKVSHSKNSIWYEEDKSKIMNAILADRKNRIYTTKPSQLLMNTHSILLNCENDAVDIEIFDKRCKKDLVNTLEKIKEIEKFSKNKQCIKKVNKMKMQ